jgi:hypothetical protein
MKTVSERKSYSERNYYFERRSHVVPDPPPPSTSTARDGADIARAMARQYLPNAVRLLAGIAFAPDSEAAAHTKMLAAKEIAVIAGVIHLLTPAPPPPHDESADNNKPLPPPDESADNNKSSPPPLLPHVGSIDNSKSSPLDDAGDDDGEPS